MRVASAVERRRVLGTRPSSGSQRVLLEILRLLDRSRDASLGCKHPGSGCSHTLIVVVLLEEDGAGEFGCRFLLDRLDGCIASSKYRIGNVDASIDRRSAVTWRRVLVTVNGGQTGNWSDI